MISMQSAALLFGVVIGWMTYFTLRNVQHQVSDIAGVIGAIGGAAVLALFPVADGLFAPYALGLTIGFFGYYLVFVTLACLSLGVREGIKRMLFGEHPAMLPAPPRKET